MTAEIDHRRYGALLARELPRVIKTEADNERALQQIARLMKQSGRSAEEDALLELLVTLVEQFEAEHYLIPDAEPREILAHMLEDRGMRPVDLVPVFGSRGFVSDILSGRRPITAAKARRLAILPGLLCGIITFLRRSARAASIVPANRRASNNTGGGQ